MEFSFFPGERYPVSLLELTLLPQVARLALCGSILPVGTGQEKGIQDK